ncbi:carbon-nitrogen hydrolase [Pseudovirgaria hyperparasitica]|uniref:Carbon-nitrogen hydrolase n=1 Tax=Pseudovirgaria hyperparasitica TaxID=470096 RepID=A0A6A6W4G7_9PEZI|nr:carbon-nitrogen hydrolase [Pseudovirgaria hyperparasitica]KAF2755941.1 carbon-nitrogen hydrolase [Pseudovirgaria hyperparasitica]
MKVAILQFAPSVGQREDNIQRAESLIVEAMPANGAPGWDWLILPEMAFSGYNFHSLEEITPYLEPTAAGRTTEWARTVASRLGCHVTIGYPEVNTTDPPKNYNSTITVSPLGEVLLNYRKTHLYYTDETWASEGPGFYSGTLGTLGAVTHGICMDINSYRFEAEWSKYEFASAALAAKSPIVVVSTAFITHLTTEALAEEPKLPDDGTLSYWLARMDPIRTATQNDRVTLVFANRCGSEGGTNYAGSSAVIRIEGGKVSILDMLGRNEEKLMVVDTDGPPKFAMELRHE